MILFISTASIYNAFSFLDRPTACGILILQPRTEPKPSAVRGASPTHWTSRNSLSIHFFLFLDTPQLVGFLVLQPGTELSGPQQVKCRVSHFGPAGNSLSKHLKIMNDRSANSPWRTLRPTLIIQIRYARPRKDEDFVQGQTTSFKS